MVDEDLGQPRGLDRHERIEDLSPADPPTFGPAAHRAENCAALPNRQASY
jgi:hypothetical protein